ncbi:N-acetylmuramic acid 6-phosphate etherase [Agromyces sp. Leaf222]|uniref:N-acetylmuramic acid 6-phosphate etherase n=1 Tax=Agromyces sp. Leaf222 TaxID=1735688 RepID=UPI0006FF348D|nr:N-acetylmuramic acid 6-phosphate etherase [Agromyces sp. Leaf222]KQM81381.1 N-acetylmuramic acid 6-phosphate etherase [Agromyces sp. Leaf222]
MTWSAPKPTAEHVELRDLLADLSTEGVNDAHAEFDLMPAEAQVAAMLDESTAAVAAVAEVMPQIAVAIDAIVARLRTGGRLVYLGAGTAGRMGVLDASEIPPTFGTDPALVVGVIAGGDTALRSAVENAEDDAGRGAADLAAIGLTAADALVGISASGRTPYVVGAIEYARELGAFTVGLACNRDSAIGRAADLAIETVVGPEIVAGSTRLKGGTAQKLVLNAISTIAMVRLGKVHGNLMVDVQATNAKLRARAERIVMQATGADAAAASAALESAGGSVKGAILVTLTGVDAEVALARLAAEHGVLRDAISSVNRGAAPGEPAAR